MDITWKKGELDILKLLRKDARMSLKEMSDKTGVPISTVYEKLRAFKPDIVHQYTALINFRELGFPIQIYFLFKTKKENKEDVFHFLSQHGRLNSIYKINNGYDFLCQAYFETMHIAEECFFQLEERFGISKMQSFYILEELKKEDFFSGMQRQGQSL